MAEAQDSGPPGALAPEERSWPTRHGGGYPPGWQVSYRCRTHRGTRDAANIPAPDWREQDGTVAGRSLRDEHTGTTWVPVRPHEAAPDAPADLVRATDILDARPPGTPRSPR